MLDYELDNEFEDEMDFNEEDIYGELGNLEIEDSHDHGFCVDCGDPNGKMGIDPYSDSAGAVYYCELCAPADLLIL